MHRSFTLILDKITFTKTTKVIKGEYQAIEEGKKKVISDGFDKSANITCKACVENRDQLAGLAFDLGSNSN